jgi:hypothetical protein
MLSRAKSALIAVIVGSVIGGAAGATILNAASASHERMETAQVQSAEHAHHSSTT